MVAVFKLEHDILIFWAEWLKMVRWQLIMILVWFIGSQLSPAVMKRSHKVKVTKKDVYLSDDNLADGKANRKERESKN